MRCMVHVTSVSVRPHENDKPAISKNSTLGTVSKIYAFGARKRRLPFVWTNSVFKNIWIGVASTVDGGISVARVYHVLSINRCNCVALVDGVSDHAASKVWEQRWVRACVCGGSWKRLPFKEPQTVTHTTVTE